MQFLRLIVPLACATVVWAQQSAPTAPSAEELVKQLGHEDYEVREEATRKLIEMGEAAVPALEQAQSSPDLEVRLRAGRALRSIRPAERAPARDGREEPAGEPGAEPGLPGAPESPARWTSVEIQQGPGGVTVRLRRPGADGKPEVREFKGESLEQLRRDHPELGDAPGGLRFEFGGGARDGVLPDPQESLERFGFGGARDREFWKRFEDEWARENERVQRWMQQARERHQRLFQEWNGPQSLPGTRTLGVRGTRPDPVLDAQLELRGRGVVIDAVEKGTPADRLGLLRHDVLIELAGTEIKDAGDVARALALRPADDELTATVVRRGQRVRLPAGD